MKKNIFLFIILSCLVINNLSGQYWSTLGEGLGYPEWRLVPADGPTDGTDAPVTGPPIASFCIYNDELYAAGFFDYADGQPAANIAKWNGTNWQAIPGIYTAGGGSSFDSWVNALLVYNGELYVAGRFTNAGDIETNNIAKWNGTTWSPVGEGLGSYGYGVSSLAVYNGELYAGGYFNNAGNLQVNNIAKWNGTNWSAAGAGIDLYSDPFLQATVSSLVVYNGELYAGGYFDTSGTGTFNNIVKWNGINWSQAGTGINEYVFAIAAYNGELYAGGNFTSLKKLDGTNWTPLTSPVNGSVYSLSVYNGSLIAGGYFDTAGVAPANYIAKWNGNNWSSIGKGLNGGALSLISYNGSLYAGGSFSSAGNVWANRVAKWTEQCISVPAQPANIIGKESACQGGRVAYYIIPVTDAADFTWTLPAGWQGTSISNRIVTLAGTSGGIISVTANNPCGSSAPQTITVTAFDTVPSEIDSIYGNNSVCEKTTQTYFVNPAQSVTSYTWTLPNGWSGNSATNTITTTAGTSGGTISVVAKNNCGWSKPRTLVININRNSIPPLSGDINGSTQVITNQPYSYSINSTSGANNYNWSVSGGGIISSGQNSNTITVNFQLPGTYVLSVNASNSCGVSSDKTITIKASVPGTPPIDDSYEIKLLPNISSGKFYVLAKKSRDKIINIEVMNMAGQKIYYSGKLQGSDNFSHLLDLNKAVAGFYIVKISVDQKTYIKKIIKTE
jgi:PKD-like domain/Secretion system C-terminal sorting domain